jgi:NitT/TauT family transport system ATP-binding protein
LATELQVDLDALLRLTETTELLGFATVAQGDITLTPLGETFAEASILARKEIFATRIRRLPMFKWLLAMLRAADKHQLEKDVISTALELDFPPDEATQQVEVAINWGRYAELLAYDDTSESLYLDAGPAPPPMAC